MGVEYISECTRFSQSFETRKVEGISNRVGSAKTPGILEVVILRKTEISSDRALLAFP